MLDWRVTLKMYSETITNDLYTNVVSCQTNYHNINVMKPDYFLFLHFMQHIQAVAYTAHEHIPQFKKQN